jgi:solute carrier family 8 (sodium/calcium exchanger)
VVEYTNKEQFCTSFMILPGTSLLPDIWLGIVYLLVLLYLFLGIAIISDIFMEAIETITSSVAVVEIVDADGNIQKVEKPVWNPTIANLTLMALGSSAPEILLSISDTVGKLEETPSELGPQAIVGSAAFNLLFISAVSIMAVDEVKKIYDMGVFVITSIAATWAYVWFFLVLAVISPGVV